MPGRKNNLTNSMKKGMMEPWKQTKAFGTASWKDSITPSQIKTADPRLIRSYANSNKETVLTTFSPSSSNSLMKQMFP